MLSRCPTGMSSDNHIVTFTVLSKGHKSPPLRLFDMAPLLPLRKVVYFDQYLVVSLICQADLLMVYLHDLVKLRALYGLEWELHFSWIFRL